MMRHSQRRGGKPAIPDRYQPTKADRLAQAKTCAVMNPGINPDSFLRSYGVKLADVLAMIEADRAKRGGLL